MRQDKSAEEIYEELYVMLASNIELKSWATRCLVVYFIGQSMYIIRQLSWFLEGWF